MDSETATQPLRGIRRVSNPPNPYERYSVEWLDAPPPPKLEVFEEVAKSIISKNDSPDVGFHFSINPYRGCHHGCSYCYARRTHQYLDFGAGTDFERKIVVKVNAPALLEKEFMKRSWEGDTIVFSGVTDCYQPLEATYEITRQLLQVCLKFKNPVVIITKGALIRRDIELLKQLHDIASVKVYVSLAFANDELCRVVEPYTPVPTTRFKVIAELAKAGIPVGLGAAPVIPGLNDVQLPELLTRAREAGAQTAFMTLLRLPAEVRNVFEERLREALPTRAEKILNGLRRMKEGELNRSTFGQRMVGEGKEWEAIDWIFRSTCERLGFNRRENERSVDARSEQRTFERPKKQLRLNFLGG